MYTAANLDRSSRYNLRRPCILPPVLTGSFTPSLFTAADLDRSSPYHVYAARVHCRRSLQVITIWCTPSVYTAAEVIAEFAPILASPRTFAINSRHIRVRQIPSIVQSHRFFNPHITPVAKRRLTPPRRFPPSQHTLSLGDSVHEYLVHGLDAVAMDSLSAYVYIFYCATPSAQQTRCHYDGTAARCAHHPPRRRRGSR